MKYLGGKSKIAKRVTRAILDHTPHRGLIYEPFCGGGSMTTVLSKEFEHVEASDIHPDLIMMLKAVQAGWIPPVVVTQDQYDMSKHAEPSAERGFIGFSCSWGAKWWGGYARGNGANGPRNYADESSRSLVRDIGGIPNVSFFNRPYTDIRPQFGDVVYCDPPYSNTTGYDGGFDDALFRTTVAEWSASGADVFISEYEGADEWECILEITRTRDMKSKLTNSVKVTERLFTPIGQSTSQSHRAGPLFANS